MHEIIITVEQDGKAVVTTKGFKGKTCKEATKQLEEALGSVSKETATSEMYEKEQLKVNNRR